LNGSRYDRSVIKSKARFTYEQAQQIIKDEVKTQKDIEAGFGCVHENDFDAIAHDIRVMNSIAVKIREARIKGGSLIFETPKKNFKLDQNLYPESFTVSKRFEAHYLVEEYMLLANMKVG
jgi:exoribonuclease R